MKKISQIQWKRYKDSAEGKEAIAMFEKLYSPTEEIDLDCIFAIMTKYDPQFFVNISKKEMNGLKDLMQNFLSYLAEDLSEENVPNVVELDLVNFYEAFTASLLVNEADAENEELPETRYKAILGLNILVSTALYMYLPQFFIPNFFVMQFMYLEKLAEKIELDLPAVPNRSNYHERWDYYLAICDVFVEFANENELTPAELCAYLYDYELPVLKEEVAYESKGEMPTVPGQAWLLVGNMSEGEKDMDYGFWQANQLTEKGDLLLFYEKSPVKALTSVWIAQEDGVVDPFFHYYSNTYIGDKISIPLDKAVTFADFKDSEYFKNRDKKGNFVSKNFQDTSGWSVTSDDYKEIRRILESKGFDTSVLPSIYEPKKIGDVIIKLEKDVSELLLTPLLEQMGWKKDIDFRGEVEFNAGRGKTGFSSDKRPDFCLHIKNGKNGVEAKVIFEVKKFMKNNKEIKANFDQGVSYARWGKAQVLVLCDMNQIRVYQRNNSGDFDEKDFIKFSWNDMENADKYAKFKSLIS